MNDLFANLMAALVFAVLGIVILIAAFVVIERLTPGTLWKELIEEHNTAVAILMGAMTIAMAIIIAAAVV